MNNRELIDKLNTDKRLNSEEWQSIIGSSSQEDREYAASLASLVTKERFGNQIFFRGIIEFSNICRNDCFYCGIRCSNRKVSRYRLTDEEILLSCKEGYELGYRTFVLQSGEAPYVESDEFISLIRRIREEYPGCAITLSVGECRRDTYERMFEAGADRYLLRHETADVLHYGKLHPSSMSLEHRIKCLQNLREIGFQVGCGMMVGTPYQTTESLVMDMEFMEKFKPAMVGIGPFIPHSETPFGGFPAGDVELTLLLLSLTRIMLPNVLLPATTALGTASEDGRIRGVLAGCNVVMPNLTPISVREKYRLYNNKAGIGLNSKESLELLREQMKTVNREVIIGRGDYRE